MAASGNKKRGLGRGLCFLISFLEVFTSQTLGVGRWHSRTTKPKDRAGGPPGISLTVLWSVLPGSLLLGGVSGMWRPQPRCALRLHSEQRPRELPAARVRRLTHTSSQGLPGHVRDVHCTSRWGSWYQEGSYLTGLSSCPFKAMPS